MLSTVFGDELLPIILPVVQQRLQVRGGTEEVPVLLARARCLGDMLAICCVPAWLVGARVCGCGSACHTEQ